MMTTDRQNQSLYMRMGLKLHRDGRAKNACNNITGIIIIYGYYHTMYAYLHVSFKTDISMKINLTVTGLSYYYNTVA